MMAVVGALALTVVGCKYDDAADDGAAADASSSTRGQNVDTVGGPAVDENGMAATELPFDKDPNYTRCTDVSFDPVYFGFDASNLASSELDKIDRVAQHLRDNAEWSSSRATATSVAPTNTTLSLVACAQYRFATISRRSAFPATGFRRRATARRSRPSWGLARKSGPRTVAASLRSTSTSKA